MGSINGDLLILSDNNADNAFEILCEKISLFCAKEQIYEIETSTQEQVISTDRIREISQIYNVIENLL